jgi:hypothetical protein
MALLTSAGEVCTRPTLLGWALGRVFRLRPLAGQPLGLTNG